MEAGFPLTGLILAGGASSRMGRPKALLPFGPERVIERQVRLLRPLCRELLVVTNDPAAFAFLGVPLVGDRAPGLGPLAGLEAGLSAASQPVVLGLACDMPLLTGSVVAALYARLMGSDGGLLGSAPAGVGSPLAAVPRTPAGPEPLCALWRREALPAIQGALAAGQRSPQRLLAQIPVAWLEGEALTALGDPTRLFHNCNTPADYEQALQLAEEGSPGGQTLRS
ncbi:MAG TPA: molybdenum cofactor guanylyltransferase [Symbiobacteriaceae bacterium]|nr:molybdenum cofactor guanylyltransferase [Symbiobacteriaceae bacterium]